MTRNVRCDSRLPVAILVAFSFALGFVFGQVYRIEDNSAITLSLATFGVAPTVDSQASDHIRGATTVGFSTPAPATALVEAFVGADTRTRTHQPAGEAPTIKPNREERDTVSAAVDELPISQQGDNIPSIDAGGIISAEGMINIAQTRRGRYSKVIGSMPRAMECDMNDNDGLALVSLAELAGVNILLESGTANGRSTEVMARYFKGHDVKVITVDIGSMGHYACSANLTETHKRLKAFSNVEARIGNSLEIFPKLIDKYKDKRIGLFIDGPKGLKALELCKDSIKRSKVVKFCAFHDVAPEHYGDTSKKVTGILQNKWGRTVLMTCCSDRWLVQFKPPAGEYPGLAVVGGFDTFPYGVKGDKSRIPW